MDSPISDRKRLAALYVPQPTVKLLSNTPPFTSQIQELGLLSLRKVESRVSARPCSWRLESSNSRTRPAANNTKGRGATADQRRSFKHHHFSFVPVPVPAPIPPGTPRRAPNSDHSDRLSDRNDS